MYVERSESIPGVGIDFHAPLTVAAPGLRPITLLAGLTSAVVRSRP